MRLPDRSLSRIRGCAASQPRCSQPAGQRATLRSVRWSKVRLTCGNWWGATRRDGRTWNLRPF